MIKLNIPREPHWITLAAGVRLQDRPATTALVMAARHAASKVAGTDTSAAGERTATLITELAKLAVMAWGGVAEDKGNPAAVTPASLAAQELSRMLAAAEVQVATLRTRVAEFSSRVALARESMKTATQLETEAAH